MPVLAGLTGLPPLRRAARQGATKVLQACTSPALEGRHALYLHNMKEATASARPLSPPPFPHPPSCPCRRFPASEVQPRAYIETLADTR